MSITIIDKVEEEEEDSVKGDAFYIFEGRIIICLVKGNKNAPLKVPKGVAFTLNVFIRVYLCEAFSEGNKTFYSVLPYFA